jgi:hypothetical protein
LEVKPPTFQTTLEKRGNEMEDILKDKIDRIGRHLVTMLQSLELEDVAYDPGTGKVTDKGGDVVLLEKDGRTRIRMTMYPLDYENVKTTFRTVTGVKDAENKFLAFHPDFPK